MTERQKNEESAARKQDNEFFATPAWVTDSILPFLYFPAKCEADWHVCDPCVGEGAILDRVQAHSEGWHKQADKPISGIEIDSGRAATAAQNPRYTIRAGDALALDWGKPSLAIFNPPFSLTEDFARKALQEVRAGGTVAMLARLAFLESAERYDFHVAHPSDIYPLSKRPGFLSSSGATDMQAYAWFVFGPDRGNRWFPLAPPPEALAKARAKNAKKVLA